MEHNSENSQVELEKVLEGDIPDKYRHLARNLADREIALARVSYKQILEGYQWEIEPSDARKHFESAYDLLRTRPGMLDDTLDDHQYRKENEYVYGTNEWKKHARSHELLLACFGDQYSPTISQGFAETVSPNLARNLEVYMDYIDKCVNNAFQLSNAGKSKETDKFIATHQAFRDLSGRARMVRVRRCSLR